MTVVQQRPSPLRAVLFMSAESRFPRCTRLMPLRLSLRLTLFRCHDPRVDAVLETVASE